MRNEVMKRSLIICCAWFSLFLMANLIAYVIYGSDFYFNTGSVYKHLIKKETIPFGEIVMNGSIGIFGFGAVISGLLCLGKYLNRKKN